MSEVASDIKVSVVIPTKNAGPFLRRVLDAVMDQQTTWPFEVLVVDSASTDGTVDLVKCYPSVRLIEISASAFGHGKTRNFATANTKGIYVAMLTQDALPASVLWLAELVRALEMDPKIAGVFGRHIAYPEASPFTRHELDQTFLRFVSQPVVSLDDRTRYEHDERYRWFLYFFSNNNALLRRAVWQVIPYPDIDFAEDQAWARLIVEAGYCKAYAHNAVVSHSHNYGLVERLQRSFDESYALRRLFNHQIGKNLRQTMRSFVGLTLRDISFAFRAGLLKTNLWHVIRMPLDNWMRVTGHYLGARADRMPQFVRERLSRDRRLMMASKPVAG